MRIGEQEGTTIIRVERSILSEGKTGEETPKLVQFGKIPNRNINPGIFFFFSVSHNYI